MLKTIQGAVLMRNCCEDDRQVLFLNECVSFPYFLDLHNFFFNVRKLNLYLLSCFLLEIGNNLTSYSFN